ncbi:GNAT family N-acetyltransferase [Acetobacterium sp.]|uniref:GNAT family N-acetyltransferase n=1 Tax=Acetobacterium sp. TaxID=1872094 RepID=UPI0035947543
MDIIIKGGQELSVEDFEVTLDLDRKIFGNEILTNQGMALKRFLKFKDGLIAAYTGNTLMGFISFFGVTDSVYQRGVFEQEYIDDNLDESEVLPLVKGKTNNILILDLAVDESFRHQGISKHLHERLWDYLRQKHNQGYLIERVFCFAITTEGHQSMLFLGGKAIWSKDNITFFELDKEIVLARR